MWEYSRVYSVTGSEYCNETADTVLYKWCYTQFLALETHVKFNDDREKWAARQAEIDNPKDK